MSYFSSSCSTVCLDCQNLTGRYQAVLYFRWNYFRFRNISLTGVTCSFEGWMNGVRLGTLSRTISLKSLVCRDRKDFLITFLKCFPVTQSSSGCINVLVMPRSTESSSSLPHSIDSWLEMVGTLYLKVLCQGRLARISRIMRSRLCVFCWRVVGPGEQDMERYFGSSSGTNVQFNPLKVVFVLDILIIIQIYKEVATYNLRFNKTAYR